MQFLRVRIQNAASDRSIPPKLPIFTGQPKWHCDRSILNAKTKKEFVFRFSFANLKTKNEKGIRYPFFVRKFENEKGKNGIYTDPTSDWLHRYFIDKSTAAFVENATADL